MDEFTLTVTQRAAELGRKFNADDIQANADLIAGAFNWAKNYSGTFNWMRQLSSRVNGGASLKASDVAGILNSVVYEVEQNRRRVIYEANKATKLQPIHMIVGAEQGSLRAASISALPVAAVSTRDYDELFPANEPGIVNDPRYGRMGWVDSNGELAKPYDDGDSEPVIDLTQVEDAPRPVQLSKRTYQAVPSGTYTVVFASGHYVTIRVQDASDTEREKFNLARGAQFIGYLNGPDNWVNYKNMGTISGGKLRIWSKYQTLVDKVQAAEALLTADRDGRNAMGIAYARQSGNCYVCGRKLTTPQSLADGIGPVCAGRV
jgi:hypothetical protein